MLHSMRRYSLLLAIFALLSNALLPFYASSGMAMPARDTAQELSALFGEKILICTAEGFAWVSWEDIKQGKGIPAPHKSMQCALCVLSSQHGSDAALLTYPATFTVLSPGIALHYFQHDNTLITHVPFTLPVSRAPPHYS